MFDSGEKGKISGVFQPEIVCRGTHLIGAPVAGIPVDFIRAEEASDESVAALSKGVEFDPPEP
jgi:hypothetical protein